MGAGARTARRPPQRAAVMTRADPRADEIYDRLRARFGEASPKASGYLSGYSFRREREMVLEAVGSGPGTVVDLACGAGLVTLPLVRAGRRVIGVDFNAAACRQAGRNGLGAVRGDAFHLPLADGLADTVLNVEFAQSYGPEAVEQMLREGGTGAPAGGPPGHRLGPPGSVDPTDHPTVRVHSGSPARMGAFVRPCPMENASRGQEGRVAPR